MAFPINVNDVRRTLTPANGTTEISVDFPFEKEEWLTVKKYNGSTETTLALTTNYTTSGEGLATGGKIILVTAANGTDIYSIALDIPVQRLSDYQKRGSLKSEVVNTDLDRLVQMLQRVGAKVDRALHRRDTDTSATDLLMPEPPASASYMQLNTDGTVTLTGTAPAVTPTYTFILPEDYGAVGDNATDDTAALQAAEDAATALASSTGKAVGLLLSGTYLIDPQIGVLKRSNVNWWGHGALKHIDYDTQPTLTVTTQGALVHADGADNWRIDGIRFFSINHEAVDSNSLPRNNGDSQEQGNWNTCIDVEDCDGWRVENCVFRGFSYGAIKWNGCSKFKVFNNDAYDDSSTTVASILAGTAPPNYPGTFAIGEHRTASSPVVSTNYQVMGNYVTVPGLDIGYQIVNYSFGEQNSVWEANIVEGARAGYQAYRGASGTLADTGGTETTYDVKAVLNACIAYACWEQGFYLRSVTGMSVENCLAHRCAGGASGASGTSAGGFVTRVNPFDPTHVAQFASQGSIDAQSGIWFLNCYAKDCGNATHCDGHFQLRIPYSKAHNCRVIRDTNLFGTRVGRGFIVDNGEGLEGCEVEGCLVYNVSDGILNTGVIGKAMGQPHRFKNNVIKAVVNGIACDSFVWNGVELEGNYVKDATGYCYRLRNSPNSVLRGNRGEDSPIGIQIAVGCLASNVPYLMTLGVKPASLTQRMGATIRIEHNTWNNVATPHSVVDGATGDGTFQGRAQVWIGDTVDGMPVEGYGYSGAALANSPRSFSEGDIIRNNATPVGAALHSSICSVAGTGGSNAVSTTCTTVSGNTTVSVIANWDGIGPGMYVSIAGTVHRVVSIDPGADTMVVDPAPGASASGVALVDSQPTFIDLLTIGAT